ncbi:hypothetical protein F5050DRAFT_1708173 [Lentinula boryana]|uniref:Non-haem dioxygenase N-terminal domain-containing protein n=1 Tax=Lentinula boryana TaxID=40481 RepID=A0ABQ8QSS9_9AGAR|nr:hypothetical protein F5050DRAFT_1708173 [Lentinula boryana]
MSYTALPEFPADIATESLRVVDYELIENGDEKEMNMLWEAATTLGFWYLMNHGLEQMVEKMFDMGEETLSLTMEEKMGHEQESPFGFMNEFHSYKTISFDPSEIELVNIAKDDVISWPKQVRSRCAYPSDIYERMDSNVAPFVRMSTKISEKILNVFDSKLGLPEGFLNRLHSAQEPSASEARTIKVPKNLPAGKASI